jgi:hypothetical protein
MSGPSGTRPSHRPGRSSYPVFFRFRYGGKLRRRLTLHAPMPVIAPALRMFAPELWGEVDKFRHFYATTYRFDERAARGVDSHFIKYQRLSFIGILPYWSGEMSGLGVGACPMRSDHPLYGSCSVSTKRRLRPSVRRTRRAASCPPSLSSGGTFQGSPTTRRPGSASGRSRVGNRCLPCPEPEPVGPNHRRRDGVCYPCRGSASPPIGDGSFS